MPKTRLVLADKGYDNNVVRRKIESKAQHRTCRQKPTDAGKTASRHISIVTAMPLNAISAGSKTFAA
jgi:hypothetical protein